MNIFFLFLNVQQCAYAYFNKHCIKIILEITQMLYSAHYLSQPNDVWITNHTSLLNDLSPYKCTHKNHPTSIWIRTSIPNYQYAVSLALALCDEYTRRYHKIHKCTPRLLWLQSNVPPCIISTTPSKSNTVFAHTNIPPECTPVPLAMPIEYHTNDLLLSYRLYYLVGKQHIADSKSQINHLIDIWQLRSIIPYAQMIQLPVAAIVISADKITIANLITLASEV